MPDELRQLVSHLGLDSRWHLSWWTVAIPLLLPSVIIPWFHRRIRRHPDVR